MKEKIKEIQEKMQKFKKWNPIIIIIEFLTSLGFIIEIFQIFTIKNYQGVWPFNHLIFGSLLALLTLLAILYNIMTYEKKIEKLFLAIVIPIGIAYATFILPLNVPDEGAHIMKANDMANGNIFIKVTEEGETSVTVAKFLENFSYMRFQNYQDIYQEIGKETNYQETVEMVCAAQGNSPLLYLGSSIALKIGEIMGLNMLIAIYMARIFNFIIFLFFGYFTIKKLPFGKLIMLVYLCMPMMLQQAASCSSDAILNATLLYYIAHIISLLYKEEITKKDKIILYGVTACIAMFKYVYILVAGLLFGLLFQKNREKKESIKIIGITILIGSLFTIGWFFITKQYQTIPPETIHYKQEVNVDEAKQLQYIKENPVKFLKTLLREDIAYGMQYIMSAIGSELGWLNVKPNMGVIILYMILLFYAVLTEKSEQEWKGATKIWSCCLVLGIATLIQIAMYMGFTPVGLERVCGVQGRYFTPILILPLFCFLKKENYVKVENRNLKLSLFAGFLNVLVLASVFQAYLIGVNVS